VGKACSQLAPAKVEPVFSRAPYFPPRCGTTHSDGSYRWAVSEAIGKKMSDFGPSQVRAGVGMSGCVEGPTGRRAGAEVINGVCPSGRQIRTHVIQSLAVTMTRLGGFALLPGFLWLRSSRPA